MELGCSRELLRGVHEDCVAVPTVDGWGFMVERKKELCSLLGEDSPGVFFAVPLHGTFFRDGEGYLCTAV